MPGATTFVIQTFGWRQSIFAELRERALNMTPLFDAIIDSWRDHNYDKFMASENMEGSGVDFQPEPTWKPLTEGYMKAKRRDGFPDWLMVRTGALAASLTTEGEYFRMVEPERAMFGTPNDPEDAAKVEYNWETRQTIFLDVVDMKNIAIMKQDYFSMGPKFKDVKFAAGLDNVQMKTEGDWIFEGGA